MEVPAFVEERRKGALERKQFHEPGWFASFFRTAYDVRDPGVEYKTMVTEDVEVPRDDLLLYAPPGVREVPIDPGELVVHYICSIAEIFTPCCAATGSKLRALEPSLFDMLVDWWLEQREAFLAWWSPSSVYVGPVDDEPWIPFTEWFRLVKEGVMDPENPPKRKHEYIDARDMLPVPPLPREKPGSCVCF